jgi:DNA repair protein SbcD/Mre11
MSIRLLAVGDMHLGRRPSRLPEEIAADGRHYGPAEAWNRTVEQAIENDIDIVALAGDLVEQEDDFFEAYRDLRAGVERLAAEGIQVVGVTGNHDVLVLPRLAAELDDFRLLGDGGQWEAFEFGNGDERLTIHGWSFPQKQVLTSPLADHRFEPGAGINLGLLHCDRDQRDSVYAPVSSGELAAAGLDGWLLGHIHRPDELTAPNPSGYLGSLSGLHPGEHGPRGPWLIEIEHGRITQVEQWPLAPIQWQRMELDLTGIEKPEDANDRLLRKVRELETEMQARRQPPQAVGLRIHLTGRTRHGGAAADRLLAEVNVATTHASHIFVEKVTVATRPETDLEQLIRDKRGTYPALMAQRLLLLDRPTEDEARQQLITGVRRKLEATVDEGRWAGLERPTLDDDQVAEWLADVGIRLLEDLENQKHKGVRQ